MIDPKNVGAYEEFIKDTEASINNENFLAANGEEIQNFGEVKVPVITRAETLPLDLRKACSVWRRCTRAGTL